MLDKAQLSGARLIASLSSLGVVLVLLVSLFLLVSCYLVASTAFNSDNLLSSAQCDDLLHGREVRDWHFPGAPYVFPDLLLLLPCQWLAPTLPLAFLAYCLLLHLGMAASLTWLARLSGLRWPTAICVAGCGAIFLAVAYAHEPMSDRACLLVHPGSHLAAIVVGLFLLALTIHSLRHPSWSLALLYVVLGSFASFSDRLLVAQFLAPLALALLLLTVFRVISVKGACIQLALIVGSFLLSCIIKWLFQQLGFHLLTLDMAPGRLHFPDLFRMIRRLYQGIAEDYLLCVLIPLHLLAALLVVGIWSRRTAAIPEENKRNRPAILLAALTFLLSPPTILGALFVLGMSQQLAINRYVLTCWYLPFLLLPLLLCWLPGKVARTAVLGMQVGILLFAVQRAAVLLPNINRQRFEQPYPPLAQVLDRLARERGPLLGLGGFWLARSTTWFTREQVVVNPLTAMGDPWFHASNPARFLWDDERAVPRYQFLLVRPGDPMGPSGSVLALHYGQPTERLAVGTDEIWLYDALRVPPFDRFLRARLADRLHRRQRYIGPIEPACLAHPKRSLTSPDAPDTIALEPDQACEVRFAQPTTGRVLDIGASDYARLEVTFFYGEERLGSVSVPNVSWTGASYDAGGIQSRLLPVPLQLSERPWDRLVIRPHAGYENVRLAHVLVFADPIAGVEEERPLPRLPRIRLEAEELLPLNPGTPYSDVTDATASAGRARSAAVDYTCPVTYTPFLSLPAGRYRLECALKVDQNSSENQLATLFVGCLFPQKKLAELPLHGSDFPAPGQWTTHQVAFEITQEMGNIQFGLLDSGKSPIAVDYFELISEPSESSFSHALPKRLSTTVKQR